MSVVRGIISTTVKVEKVVCTVLDVKMVSVSIASVVPVVVKMVSRRLVPVIVFVSVVVIVYDDVEGNVVK